MKKKIIYEMTFSILAIIAVSITVLDLAGKISLSQNSVYYYIDLGIMIIFVFDYFIRLIFAKNKKIFLKQNIPDLIAIIPFNSLFKIFRLTKLFRLTRLLKFGKLLRLFGLSGKFYKNAKRFLHTNGLIYILFFSLIVIGFGAIGIYITEKNVTVNSFPDAVWWSFVTATTVGYGDISPSTMIGRIIASILMLVGIGTIGMLTGTIATYFLSKKNTLNESDQLENSIMESNDLTEQDKEKVVDYIRYLKYSNSKNKINNGN